jgi:hypothetical protein
LGSFDVALLLWLLGRRPPSSVSDPACDPDDAPPSELGVSSLYAPSTEMLAPTGSALLSDEGAGECRALA